MKSNWINRNWVTVIIHVLAWLIVFSLPYLLRYTYDDRMRNDPQSVKFVYLGLTTNVLWICTFYLNAFLLVPKLIYPKKYLLYSLVTIVLFSCVLLVHAQLFHHFLPQMHFTYGFAALVNVSTFLLAVATGIAFRFLRDKSRYDRLQLETQEENLKTELSFLRSQISPHFVFNILNNITALARLKSDELEPTVMKLSSLLRYMLYETNEEKVSLQTEIEYLQSYIDLQQQRFGQKVKIETDMQTGGGTISRIEPMLLIPFVENAFKHGIGMVKDPRIVVSLSIQGNVLQFSVGNKYIEHATEVKDHTSGIGLANVKRRLNLLYNRDYSLLISKKDDWFLISLQLNLR